MSTQKNEHNPDDDLCRCRELGDPECPIHGDTGKGFRFITPPTDTTGSGREGETPEIDAIDAAWDGNRHLRSQLSKELFKRARQLERQRDAALAVIRQTAVDTADPSDDLETKRRIIHKRCRAAIDSAQRQEGSKVDWPAAKPHEC